MGVGAVDIRNLLLEGQELHMMAEVYINVSESSCVLQSKGRKRLILRVVGLGRVLLVWCSITSMIVSRIPRHIDYRCRSDKKL